MAQRLELRKVDKSVPGIRGVFAANDEMSLGAIKAVGGKAGEQVKVVGFDGMPEGLAAAKAGTLGPGKPTNIPVQVVDPSNLARFTRHN